MLKNFFKLAIRSLYKNKLYTGINVIGLSIGIAAVILIYKIVNHEQSYNKNFKNYDRIVRVIRQETNKEDGIGYTAGNPLPALEVMKKSIPQFEITAKVREVWPTLAVPNPDGGHPLKKFDTNEGELSFFTEPSFFKIFDMAWLAGSPETALQAPHTIVLTKSLALKCFGGVDQAMGQYLILDNLQPNLKVEGVVEDANATSDFPVLSYISYQTFRTHPEFYFYSDEWGSTSSNDQFFGLLQSPDQLDAVNLALASIGKEEYKDDRIAKQHIAQPLSDLHYNEEVGTSGNHIMDKKKLTVLSLIGFMVLIIACFNFINMANAQSVTRAKEVGIRKTLGIGYGQLMSNFLVETALLVGVSLLIGLGIAYLTTPLLQYISPLPDNISLLDGQGLILFLSLLFVTVTLLAGIYPATILSSFKPIQIFRAGFEKSLGSGVVLRKTLVVLQFVIAFGLIISTVITLSQLSFIRNMDLGFKKDLIYTFGYNNDSSTQSKLNALKYELKKIPGVELVSVSSDRPSSGNTWSSNWALNTGKDDAPFHISQKYCDEDYLKTYQIKLLAGRWLEASDTSREAVLNRTALKRLGITDFASVLGNDVRLGGRTMKLVGVAEDYHSHSAHEPLEPLLMTTRKAYYFVAGVKIKPNDIQSTVASIEKTYNNFFPEQVFKGRFYDEEIQRFYEADTQFTSLCKSFAVLAIIISCLGLFALASFAISRRIKEIGVRKVLGASTQNIVRIISMDFLWLVLIAFVIAAPLSWYFMNNWLQDFVFKITISWWMFAVSVILVLGIALATVSIQAIQAAWTNPIKSLRSE